MDPRTNALLFLLEEKSKMHPSSEAATKARSLMEDVKKVEEKRESVLMSTRGPLPGHEVRVPIAGTETRPRDLGEDKGVTPGSAGTEADLL